MCIHTFACRASLETAHPLGVCTDSHAISAGNCPRGARPPANRILKNRKIWAVNKRQHQAEALAIRRNRVIAQFGKRPNDFAATPDTLRAHRARTAAR
jgi:hypothetical protein